MVINSFKKMLKINKQLTLGICLAFYALASQGAYPDKSIRLVVPFATGGTSEIIARSVANALTTQMGQSVFVENKPGGAGNIAMEEVKRAAPDGLSLIHI